MAGYRKEGKSIEKAKYFVYPDEIIFRSEPVGEVDMNLAYRRSSNCYFIHLMNDKDLFSDMAHIYGTIGAVSNNRKSYLFDYSEPSNEWISSITEKKGESIRSYESYMTHGANRTKNKMSNKDGYPNTWSWSWGQGGIDVTPLSMARGISIVANDGKMPVTRFLLSDPVEEIDVLDDTEGLVKYLKDTRKYHERERIFSKMDEIGGKTGTPERVSSMKRVTSITAKGVTKEIDIPISKRNDGWYVCFIENCSVPYMERIGNGVKREKTTLAVAVRIERLGIGEMSGHATKMMDAVIIKVLRELDYIN